jgi:hypothetical protein
MMDFWLTWKPATMLLRAGTSKVNLSTPSAEFQPSAAVIAATAAAMEGHKGF